MPSEPVIAQPVSRRTIRLIAVTGIAVAVIVVVSGVAVRAVGARDLRTWTSEQTVPTVNLVQPKAAASGSTLDLPSRLEAFSRAPIFARVSGYLKSWDVDIGGQVKAGQLLAVIESPELDQQLIQARADLATAQANAALAATTAKRWQALLGTDSVAKQDVDDRTGDYAAKKAVVAAAQANVERLVATKGFERIIAPFDGTVTSRDTDIGALINAGSGGVGQELFTVSDVKQLRVYVQVPQNYAPIVQVGTVATLNVPEYPGQHFTARVIASANAVNASSGTTLVQLLVDNSNGKLMPGGFASLQFKLPVQADAVRIPASALVFDARGLRVATVDANNHVAFKTVTISRDFGDAVEIGSGLTAADRVIDTPPDGLIDGDSVKVAAATATSKAVKNG
ncbi:MULTISPECIES: efflux RND transporter periplasmic adaptor subunit [Paraburkholderia]|uniref:efflux RND transporter periplasmic adaptor subunit n=1 Tax=Paraburkholderia TaxID=1822464 RepID=UPI00224E8109|nr:MULTISPECIES: efflux RND transporter periplasmic adaptor subunit [Paraburkholderia]MCX4161325.1 efflux RND transporter periplasmic adaptor subunit [Paraburkholderia megapolitana]MDN7156821.1 efflux RND transporter periplasmic adaptor subunit [Paraburkholderia sp. CHISQ3]MDQ6493866.1 efflux RND transporter periplasmic adaptor subunit [Paraburkholderia megapolitana]